jgi:ferrochelatase
MSYQSKFGPGEWIRPYTVDVSSDSTWLDNRKKVLVVPLAFTSDHIETLSEIENQYLPLLKELGVKAHRVSAINRLDYFVNVISTILKEHEDRPDSFVANQMMLASYCPFPCFCPRLGFCGCVKNRD